jgi:protein BCP1
VCAGAAAASADDELISFSASRPAAAAAAKRKQKKLSSESKQKAKKKKNSKKKTSGTKRKRGDDESDSDDNGHTERDNDEIEVEFLGNDPSPNDYHTVKMLLRNYIPFHDFGLNEFAELICNQVSVGTMVKGEGTDEPLGFSTALSLQRHKDQACVQQLQEDMLCIAPNAETRQQLADVLGDEKNPVGLIVQERLINLPYDLVPKLHQALCDDLKWAVANETSDELKASFQFSRFVLLTRCFDGTGLGVHANQTKPSKKRKKHKRAKVDEGSLFRKYEEAEYFKVASLSFAFDASSARLPTDAVSSFDDNKSKETAKQTTSSHTASLPQSCVVMVLDAAQLAVAANNIVC